MRTIEEQQFIRKVPCLLEDILFELRQLNTKLDFIANKSYE